MTGATQILESLDITTWQAPFPPEIVARAADALESGNLLYAPQLPFPLSESERRFLSPDCLDGKSKNLSFRPASGTLKGTRYRGSERDELLAMLRRYYQQASGLVHALCPGYGPNLQPGFTSFRPAEIAGRSTSPRHDDTRLHVDAFPSRPMQGLRILRVFTNVNPAMPRLWRVGERFEQAAAHFLPKINPPAPFTASLLHWLRITKGRRTPYDHYMLGIHDRMKADQTYQSQVPQTNLEIPPGATWACFTDVVSHAATSGQFAFEQTFYLPVSAMNDPQRSPLCLLERLVGHTLA
ncbi:MAG: Kdo hydroxylase family protein [Terriglobales bacterium]|jgi:3-deoxy-D-manno-octulosonic acid hydroxylase-like protein